MLSALVVVERVVGGRGWDREKEEEGKEVRGEGGDGTRKALAMMAVLLLTRRRTRVENMIMRG
jgi:hypothetical protein